MSTCEVLLMQQDPQHGLGPGPMPAAFTMPSANFAPMRPPAPYAPQMAPSFQQVQQPTQQPHRPQQQRGRGQQQQHLPQQHSQSKALGPRTSRGKKRKHRWHNKQQTAKDSGLQSLAALTAQNRRRAQQHFGNDTPSEAPRTVPHAPLNDNAFILSQHSARGETPGMTPGFSLPSNMQWTPAREGGSADYSSLDKDAADLGAQLDFFGTNDGLVARYSSDDESSDGEGEGSEEDGELHHGWRLRTADEADGTLPPYVRERLSDQSAYIQKLEAQNLDLQERCSLLQHELQELKATHTTSAAAVGPAKGTDAVPPAKEDTA